MQGDIVPLISYKETFKKEIADRHEAHDNQKSILHKYG